MNLKKIREGLKPSRSSFRIYICKHFKLKKITMQDEKNLIENIKTLIAATEDESNTFGIDTHSFGKAVNESMRYLLRTMLGNFVLSIELDTWAYKTPYFMLERSLKDKFPVTLANKVVDNQPRSIYTHLTEVKEYKTRPTMYKIRMERPSDAHDIICRLHNIENPYQYPTALESTNSWGGKSVQAGNGGTYEFNGNKVECRVNADGDTLEVRGLSDKALERLALIMVADTYTVKTKGVEKSKRQQEALKDFPCKTTREYINAYIAEFEAMEEGKVKIGW